MTGKRLFHSLALKNFLSFGSEGEEVELQPLNVLIGPNGAGKSNLIEALGVLRAAPRDLAEPIRKGGGIGEWLWKGAGDAPEAEFEAVVEGPRADQLLLYDLRFMERDHKLAVLEERITDYRSLSDLNEADSLFLFNAEDRASAKIKIQLPPEVLAADGFDGRDAKGAVPVLVVVHHNPEASIFSQSRDPTLYPEVTFLGDQFSRIHIYQMLPIGRDAKPREPKKADLPDDFLLEDGSNLAAVLKNLEQRDPLAKEKMVGYLGKFNENVVDYSTRIIEGWALTYLHERGLNRPIFAGRISDGQLRFLCLLAILCHPEPPPVVCIEEPELGMHPDILPTVAELLIDASQRTQLIVTTHSADLISALWETPEAIIVCERDEVGTHLRRLDPVRLEKWLEDYSLGELWRSGEIGGNRW